MHENLAIESRPLVEQLMRSLGGAEFHAGHLPHNPYEHLTTLAPIHVLSGEDPLHDHYSIWAGFSGTGAMLAGAWLATGKRVSRAQAIDGALHGLLDYTDGTAPVSASRARELFEAGFDWLVLHELPHDSTSQEAV